MDLDHGQFQKILNGVNGKMIAGPLILVHDQAKTHELSENAGQKIGTWFS